MDKAIEKFTELSATNREASGKTAMHRTGPSAPFKRLCTAGVLMGRILDYGCGHGADVRAMLDLNIDAIGWDPVHSPDTPIAIEAYDTVLCTYVLNTLPTAPERRFCVMGAMKALKPGGHLYLTVRRDLKRPDGYTSQGTWQGNIDVLDENPAFRGISLISLADFEIVMFVKAHTTGT